MSELTALGAAMAAGMAVGAWNTDVAGAARKEKTFEAQMSAVAWTAKYKDWQRALTKSFDWVDDHHE
jgi:glycerol kinase